MDNVQFLLQDNGGDDEEQVNDDQVKELVVVVIPSLITTVVAFVLYYILKRRKSLWPVYYSRWELFLQRTQAEGVSVSSSDESRQIEEARPEAAGIDEESAQVSREVEQVFPPVTDEYARPPSVMRMFRLAFFSLAKLVYGPVVLSRQYVHWVYQQRELNEDDPGDQTEIELQDDPRMDYNSERRRPEIGRHVGHITQNRFVQRVLQKARVEANRGIAFPSIGLDGAAMLHFLKFALILSLALLLINLIVLLPTYVTDGEDETGDLDKLSILHVVDDNGRWWAFALAALVVVVLGCIGLRSFWKGYLQLQEVWMARKLQGRDGPVTGQDYEALLSTRVALIRGIPSHLRSEDALRSFLYECVPWAAEQNRVEHIVLLHSHNDIQDKVETVQKSSESVLKKVQKHNQKSDKKLRKGKCTEGELREENNEFQATEVRPLLAELSAQVDELRAAVENERETPDSNTAAVICSDMATATALGHAWLTRDTRMLRMHANVAARDVDWQQVDVAPAENDRQRRSSTILFALVVILWTFPVAFVLSISRLDKLTDTIGFLDFVNDLPSGVRAAIQSLLPAIGLAVLFFILKSVVLMRLARRVSATRHRQYMWAASAYTSQVSSSRFAFLALIETLQLAGFLCYSGFGWNKSERDIAKIIQYSSVTTPFNSGHESWQVKMRQGFFVSAMLITCGLLALTFAVTRAWYTQNFRQLWLARMLRSVASVVITIGYIPLLATLLFGTKCADIGVENTASCAVLATGTSLVVLGFVTVSIVFTSAVYNGDITDVSARLHSKCEIVRVIARTVLVFAFTYVKTTEDGYKLFQDEVNVVTIPKAADWLLCVLLIVCFSSPLLSYTRHMPYHAQTSNRFRMMQFSGLTAAAGILLLNLIWISTSPTFEVDGATVVVPMRGAMLMALVCAALCALLGRMLHASRLKTVRNAVKYTIHSGDIEGIAERQTHTWDALLLARDLILLLEVLRDGRAETKRVAGLEETLEWMRATNVSVESQADELMAKVPSILGAFASKFPDDPEFCLYRAEFVLLFGESVFPALKFVNKAERHQKLSFDARFRIFRLQRRVGEDVADDTMLQHIEIDQAMRDALEFETKSYRLLVSFWNHLKYPRGQHDKVVEIVREMSVTVKKAKNSFEKLLQLGHETPDVLRRFAFLQQNLLGNDDRAIQLRVRASALRATTHSSNETNSGAVVIVSEALDECKLNIQARSLLRGGVGRNTMSEGPAWEPLGTFMTRPVLELLKEQIGVFMEFGHLQQMTTPRWMPMRTQDSNALLARVSISPIINCDDRSGVFFLLQIEASQSDSRSTQRKFSQVLSKSMDDREDAVNVMVPAGSGDVIVYGKDGKTLNSSVSLPESLATKLWQAIPQAEHENTRNEIRHPASNSTEELAVMWQHVTIQGKRHSTFVRVVAVPVGATLSVESCNVQVDTEFDSLNALFASLMVSASRDAMRQMKGFEIGLNEKVMAQFVPSRCSSPSSSSDSEVDETMEHTRLLRGMYDDREGEEKVQVRSAESPSELMSQSALETSTVASHVIQQSKADDRATSVGSSASRWSISNFRAKVTQPDNRIAKFEKGFALMILTVVATFVTITFVMRAAALSDMQYVELVNYTGFSRKGMVTSSLVALLRTVFSARLPDAKASANNSTLLLYVASTREWWPDKNRARLPCTRSAMT
ncbi:MAG: hypothetical protein MHM6MM_002121 [Cercozoa sp. M6MM]